MTRFLSVICRACLALPAAALPQPTGAAPDLSSYLQIDSVAPGAITPGISTSTDTYMAVTLTMHNVGPKAITAYRVTLGLEYPDGIKAETGWTVDFAYPIAEMTTPGVLPIPNSTLNPGERHTLTQSFRLAEPWQRPAQMTPTVTMLVFDDQTGLGDPKHVDRVFAGRVQMAHELSTLLGMVRDAEASPEPSRRYAELISAARSGGPTHGGFNVPRLDLYRTARGTPTFGLMLKVDTAAQGALEKLAARAPAQGEAIR